MNALVFVDTNVLLYRHDDAKPEKQQAAEIWLAHLWRTRTGRLSIQVLQEFYLNATQKLKVARLLGLADRTARLLLQKWTADGWLIVADPSRRGRVYELSASYRQLVGKLSAKFDTP